MLFHSLPFLVFFAVVLAVYWRLGHRAQNRFLLAASLFFYGYWNEWLLLLLLGSASIDYVCGLGLEKASGERVRRAWLTTSIVSNLLILGFFKYANFFLDSLTELLGALGFAASRPALDVLLPVGISFYTFQAMSYVVDIWRRQLAPCRDYLDYLLYISFFPQLVAGPIERGTRLLPQIVRPRPRLNVGARLEGLKLIAVGYAQKVAIADVLAGTVDDAFSNAGQRGSLTLLVALYAFAFQIYCDFAGYSNIARGLARLLGIRLMRNFDQPYLASSITDFWRRWHVSLSTWLRDYLYIPLGGNRLGPGRTYLNLMVTMLLGGLWHGASWTFVVWGGLHGLYLAAHKAFFARRAPHSRLGALLGALVTFHLVCLAWVFFRAADFAEARAYLNGLVALRPGATSDWTVPLYLAFALVLDLLLARNREHLTRLVSRHWLPETVFVVFLLLLAIYVGDNHVVPFVYFQF